MPSASTSPSSPSAAKTSRVPSARPASYRSYHVQAKRSGGGSGTRVKRRTSGSESMAWTAGRWCSASGSSRTVGVTGPTLCDRVTMRRPTALILLALAAPATAQAVDGPITRLATAGGRPDVIARADGSAVAVWEEKPTAATANVHLCRIAAGAGTCLAGSEKVLTGAAGTTTSKPFVFDISGGRMVVVHGGCCPQHTNRWITPDGGATF